MKSGAPNMNTLVSLGALASFGMSGRKGGASKAGLADVF